MATATMTLTEYEAECKRLFHADRYGWSVWEREEVQYCHTEGIDAQECVYRMNDAWARRKANRNV